MSNTTQIEQLIPHGSFWKLKNEDFAVYANFNAYEAGMYSVVTQAELVEIDSRLPKAIRILRDQYKELMGVMIRRTYLVWQTPVKLMNTEGTYAALTDVKDLKLTTKFAQFIGTGYSYTEELVPGTQEKLLIAGDSSSKRFTVAISWLDTNYPGWHERFNMAASLDLDFKECVAAMCLQHATQIPTVLPNDIEPAPGA